MAINVNVLNGGFLPDMITVDPALLSSGNPIKYHEEVSSVQLMIPPKRFDISPPVSGMLRRLICLQTLFLETI